MLGMFGHGLEIDADTKLVISYFCGGKKNL